VRFRTHILHIDDFYKLTRVEFLITGCPPLVQLSVNIFDFLSRTIRPFLTRLDTNPPREFKFVQMKRNTLLQHVQGEIVAKEGKYTEKYLNLVLKN
jgi:hypothetical protein